jgi:hypothetical protein
VKKPVSRQLDRGLSRKPRFPSGGVSSVSFVSTTNTARSLAAFVSLAFTADAAAVQGEHHSFTGVRTRAPLPFNNTTTNLAGSVLLTLRPTR